MLNWLRQRVRYLERRWIRDPDERAEHQELVRERLAMPAADAGAVGDAAEPEPAIARDTRVMGD